MDRITSILLGLTAGERWAAARRMSPHSMPQQWLVLLGVAVLLVLVVLVLAISFRRRQQNQGQRAQQFDTEGLRRGLTTRERQILLAIAGRSGLRRKADIFHAEDAFQRGATQLLAEFARTHGPQESTELKAEVARLREKLRFPTASGGPAARRRPGSRDIPPGKSIELTGGKEHGTVTIQAEVLRNDEMELVVALPARVPSKAGDPWLARYYSGMTAWEFRTSTVRCDGTRLTLRHSDEIRPINRRRFPRVPVRVPALIASLPLLREGRLSNPPVPAAAQAVAGGRDAPEAIGAYPPPGAPAFVDSTVTEFAGPGLRLQTRLQVHVDDRVLVVMHLALLGKGGQKVQCTLAGIGRVRRGQDMEGGTAIPDAIDRVWEGVPPAAARPLSIVVELIGLNEKEIAALASLTDMLSSLVSEDGLNRATKPQETTIYTTVAP